MRSRVSVATVLALALGACRAAPVAGQSADGGLVSCKRDSDCKGTCPTGLPERCLTGHCSCFDCVARAE